MFSLMEPYELTGTRCEQLTHGSFTSVFSTLGQQALELQLERFFTPWAWSWNLEDHHDFQEHLGIPALLHELGLHLISFKEYLYTHHFDR